MPRLTHLTEDEFIARFQPEENDEGGLYVQRDWGTEAERALNEKMNDERRCWTMVSTDDELGCGIVQGWCYVNRLYYIFCAVPWDEDEDVVITMDD